MKKLLLLLLIVGALGAIAPSAEAGGYYRRVVRYHDSCGYPSYSRVYHTRHYHYRPAYYGYRHNHCYPRYYRSSPRFAFSIGF